VKRFKQARKFIQDLLSWHQWIWIWQ